MNTQQNNTEILTKSQGDNDTLFKEQVITKENSQLVRFSFDPVAKQIVLHGLPSWSKDKVLIYFNSRRSQVSIPASLEGRSLNIPKNKTDRYFSPSKSLHISNSGNLLLTSAKLRVLDEVKNVLAVIRVEHLSYDVLKIIFAY